jgi:hypothetical protein
MDELQWASPTLRFVMINDIMFSTFLIVFMLSSLLEITLSKDRQNIAKYENFRLIKTQFPLKGRQHFLVF